MTAAAAFPRTLLFCKDYQGNARTITDHLAALESLPNVQKFPTIGELPAELDLGRFDALVIHYTVYAAKTMDSRTRRRIREFPGLKVQFIQDEYRTVDETVDTIRELGIDVLFTCVPTSEIPRVYSPARLPNVRIVNTLTGFVSDELVRMQVPDISSRPIDVGYRTRIVPYWLGELGAEKWRIAPKFRDATAHHGFKLDLSWIEEDRVYGAEWVRFLTACKVVLGVESGASIFDFTGKIQKKVERYVVRHPDAEFEDVQARFFRHEEGKIRLNQISPRCFEAAALRTAMVLYEGDYSGVLNAWQHYIPLRKDFGNIEDVCKALKDVSFLRELTQRTYREIALNPAYSYERFAKECGTVIQEEIAIRKKPVMASAYSAEEFAGIVARQKPQHPWRYSHPLVYLFYLLWLRTPSSFRHRMKPLLLPIVRNFFPIK